MIDSALAGGPPAMTNSRRPAGVSIAIHFTSTLFRIFCDRSCGRRGRPGQPESLDRRLRGADLAVQPHLAMGGEPGHIEQAHRQQDEADRDRKDARREAEAVQRRREPRRACLPGERFGERGRFGAAFASGRKV